MDKGKKFLGIEKTPVDSSKEYTAIFQNKRVNFGQKGSQQYPEHKNKKKRENYIKRHLSDLKTNDPQRAGYLSMFILWNKPTLQQSIKDYKRRYNIYLKTGKFPINIQNEEF